MVNFYEFISREQIKNAPHPLHIGDEDIFTTDESIYNENGYYRLEREEYPQDETHYYTPYYELEDNVIWQKWEQGELIEEADTDAD